MSPVTTVQSRALRGEHKVDAGSATLSGQASDHVLEILPLIAPGQDQVREFIEHQDDEREIDAAGLGCGRRC